MAAVVLLAAVAIGSTALAGARAQPMLSDADLRRASSRTVAVRARATGAGISVLPLEVYVARVLAGEGEPGAAEGAQQALAIAIRTYAVANAGRHRRDGYDLCDTTHCQVVRAATASSRRAALATAGLVLTHEGAPAEVFYSASCGGRSESADQVWPAANFPYLRSVPDDVHDRDAAWTLELPLGDVQRALARAGFAGRLTDLRVDGHNSSGRVARVRVIGMRPDSMTGVQLRSALGPTELRSTAFSVVSRAGSLQFTGRGYGHGVGMCVVGAGRRARRGDTAAAILGHYFPGLEVKGL